jgi:hypothetical protein
MEKDEDKDMITLYDRTKPSTEKEASQEGVTVRDKSQNKELVSNPLDKVNWSPNAK